MNLFLKAGIALGLLWAVVAGLMWMASNAKVTPEKIAAYVEENSLEGREDDAERMQIVRKVADQLNQLDHEQRREAREAGSELMWEFQKHMKPEERVEFTKLTIGPTFDHLMKALNEMEPEERKRLTRRALDSLRDSDGPPRGDRDLGENGEELLEKVTSEGMRAYYEQASAETKVDLAPVLEQIQDQMQHVRRGRKAKEEERRSPYEKR